MKGESSGATEQVDWARQPGNLEVGLCLLLHVHNGVLGVPDASCGRLLQRGIPPCTAPPVSRISLIKVLGCLRARMWSVEVKKRFKVSTRGRENGILELLQVGDPS